MCLPLLVDIDGFVCELQINLSCILKIKESDAGHGQYEEERKAIDDMIYCAMQGPASEFAAKLDKVKAASVFFFVQGKIRRLDILKSCLFFLSSSGLFGLHPPLHRG